MANYNEFVASLPRNFAAAAGARITAKTGIADRYFICKHGVQYAQSQAVSKAAENRLSPQHGLHDRHSPV